VASHNHGDWRDWMDSWAESRAWRNRSCARQIVPW